jgi:hypothetical protein
LVESIGGLVGVDADLAEISAERPLHMLALGDGQRRPIAASAIDRFFRFGRDHQPLRCLLGPSHKPRHITVPNVAL